MNPIRLYSIEYNIDGVTYSANLPARDFSHAEHLAFALCGRVTGHLFCEVPAVSIEELMDVCDQNAVGSIYWRSNAKEQIQAFIAMGHPVEPTRAGAADEGGES